MDCCYIPSPKAMHARTQLGTKEDPISELPMFQVVTTYLQSSKGDGYSSATICGVRTSEVVRVPISDAGCYEQVLLVAGYLWDIGYYVTIHNPRIPGGLQDKEHAAPELVICWDPQLIRRRQLPCPCWACVSEIEDKLSCIGCNKFFSWRQANGIN